MKTGSPPPRARWQRVVEMRKLLVNQIHLSGNDGAHQLSCVSEINSTPPAAFQSMQFREIEFASGLKHQSLLNEFREDEFAQPRLQKRFEAHSLGDTFYAALRKRGLDAPANEDSSSDEERQKALRKSVPRLSSKFSRTLRSETKSFNQPKLCWNTDEYFALWRSHHIKMVERMVGTKRGTGGSEGVGLLADYSEKKFFPEL